MSKEFIMTTEINTKGFQPVVGGVYVQELIRCKDCKWFSQTTLGMDYACWRGGSLVWGETGEHEGHHCCIRIESEDHYCGYAERRTE